MKAEKNLVFVIKNNVIHVVEILISSKSVNEKNRIIELSVLFILAWWLTDVNIDWWQACHVYKDDYVLMWNVIKPASYYICDTNIS